MFRIFSAIIIVLLLTAASYPADSLTAKEGSAGAKARSEQSTGVSVQQPGASGNDTENEDEVIDIFGQPGDAAKRDTKPLKATGASVKQSDTTGIDTQQVKAEDDSQKQVESAAAAEKTTDSPERTIQPPDSTDSLPEPCKIVMQVKGKDVYETLLITTSTDTFSDTLISFMSPDSTIHLGLDYSGFKKIQKIDIGFYHNSIHIDSSQAPRTRITSKFKPESRALLMQVTLAPAGWTTVMQCDSSFAGMPSPLTINTRKSSRNLGKSAVKLPLNRYDINSVTVTPQKPYRQGTLLIDFQNPYGPPSIIKSSGLKAGLTLDKEKNRALISVSFLPKTANVRFTTKVRYARAYFRSIKTGEQTVVEQTTGEDDIELFRGNTYECIFRKPGYNPLRKVITVPENDTIFTFTWEPYDSQPIILRSLALPGFGQYYSERDKWWIWPIATGTSALITGISCIALINNKNDFNEYNDKYLTESNAFARQKYDDKRRDALGDWRASQNIFIVSLATLGVVWAANVGDAFFFAIDPNTKVTINPIPGKKNITIDF